MKSRSKKLILLFIAFLIISVVIFFFRDHVIEVGDTIYYDVKKQTIHMESNCKNAQAVCPLLFNGERQDAMFCTKCVSGTNMKILTNGVEQVPTTN